MHTQLNQRLAVAVGLAVAAGPASLAAAGPVPWGDFQDAWIGPNPPGPDNPFVYAESLGNGGFEAGGLAPWAVTTQHRANEWGVLQGSGGAVPFGPGDGSHFATPWTSGGGWSLGQTSVLTQSAALPAGHTGDALVRFEAVWAYDAIAFELTWLDAAGAAVGPAVSLGTYGGRPGVGNDLFRQVLPVPADATGFAFTAAARLADGTWIDAGFDRASVVTARPVPEPGALAAAWVGAGALLAQRRRRAS